MPMCRIYIKSLAMYLKESHLKLRLVHFCKNLIPLQVVSQEGMEVQSGLAVGLLYRRRELNDRLLRAERAFLDSEGIPGASWYKHLVLTLHHELD